MRRFVVPLCVVAAATAAGCRSRPLSVSGLEGPVRVAYGSASDALALPPRPPRAHASEVLGAALAEDGVHRSDDGAAPAPEAGAAEGEAPGGQSLEQAANDPTASIMSVQVQNLYVPSYHRLPGVDSDTLQFRAALPFKTGCLNHIARATLPVVVEGSGEATGVSDLTLFDLVVFDAAWGRWGVGVVGSFPTASDDSLGTEKWTVGPAIGFTARAGKKVLWGAFNQNLFSYAGADDRDDVGLSTLQPILNVSLPCKWSVGFSEMTLIYDWERSDWIALPLGFKVAKMLKMGGLPLQVSVTYEHNFADEHPGPEDTLGVTLKFMFPIG